MTGVALVNVISNDIISESQMCFMSIVSVRSNGVCSDGAVFEEVDEEGAGDEVAEVVRAGGAKKTVREAGPS